MGSSRATDLRTMADEIEKEMAACESDLRRVGSLSIKVHSFANMVQKLDPGEQAAGLLKAKADAFRSRARVLSDRRTMEKLELEQEMESSRIKYKKITEAQDSAFDSQDSEFFSRQSSKLDEFISSSMDSLESLRRQGAYIDRISSTMRDGLQRLGVGSDTLRRIESRLAGDKTLFLVLMGALALLILVLKIIF